MDPLINIGICGAKDMSFLFHRIRGSGNPVEGHSMVTLVPLKVVKESPILIFIGFFLGSSLKYTLFETDIVGAFGP
jgi:hypothetical protein